jgi:hypothetical protein
MSDLIAIGYPDEATAEAAADEARRLAQDLIIEPDAIAVIVRDKSGDYHVHTRHHMVGAGATWGMFWGLLFGLLFFIPVFGMAIGAGLGALMGKRAGTPGRPARRHQRIERCARHPRRCKRSPSTTGHRRGPAEATRAALSGAGRAQPDRTGPLAFRPGDELAQVGRDR